MRPTWDEYFLQIAQIVSTRATCPRRHVGVVLVDKQHRVVSMGYNGAPSGLPQCDEIGCRMENGHCRTSIHGEMNALLCTDSRNRLNGATCYIVGGTPCATCANALVNVGVMRIVCDSTYPDKISFEILKAAKVIIEQKLYKESTPK